MKRFVVPVLALLIAVTSSAAELTLDEILAKHAAARGGLDRLHAVQSVRLTGTMSMHGADMPLTITKKRPEKMRLDFIAQGMTATHGYDGANGWQVMPFMGKKDAEPLAGEMLAQIREEADFDGALIDSAKKGYKIELLGKSDIEGTPAYKLHVTKDAMDRTVYLDADSFLEIRADGKRTMQGQETETETTIGNYQDVDGVLFAYSLEIKRKGQAGGQRINITKVELNPAVADELFTIPAKKTEAPAPKPQ
jgi:outer membrane lipoprotein-sorting protein